MALRVRAVVEALMREQRKHAIEYRGFLSNHMSWVVIVPLRLGAPVEEVRRRAAAYAAHLEAAPAAPPAVQRTSEQLDALVNAARADYGALLSFFDAEIADELARRGAGEADVAAALDAVCARHLPRVARGSHGAAFHAVLEAAAGVEALSPAVTANGLAYMHTRCWRDVDTHPTVLAAGAADAGAELLRTLGAWTGALLAPSGQAELRAAVAAGHDVQLEIGGFQKRMRAVVERLTCFAQQPVVLPAEAPQGVDPDALCRHYGLDLMFVFAATALPLSDNEFFVLHGLTSLWAVRQLVRGVPSLSHEARCELVGSWLRGYFAAYAAQGLPAVQDVAAAVGLLQEADGVAAAVRRWGRTPREGRDAGTDGWAGVLEATLPFEEEHIAKAAWMLRETARELPAEAEPLLFAAAHRLATLNQKKPGSNVNNKSLGTLRLAEAPKL